VLMVEWFNNLTDANKIAIVVPVGLAAIGVLFALFKWLFSKSAKQKTIKQKGQGNTAIIFEENKGNVAGRDIHTGVDTEVLNAALKAINKALEMVGTDQSNKLASELEKLSDEKLNILTELIPDKHNKEQTFQLEKEFQLYSELWKALDDVRS